MTRLLFALLLALGLAGSSGAAPAPRRAAAVDWLNRVTVTPAGTYVRGNPAAKVKLVEYFSFTCPHCAHFHEEAKAGLEAMIRTGRLSFEGRHFMIQPFDLVPPLVARCRGPQRYFAAQDAILANQKAWEEKLYSLPRDRADPNPMHGAAVLVRDSGLGALAAPGLDLAGIQACIADKGAQAQVAKMMDDATARGVDRTPTFFVNGRESKAATWAELSAELKAAMQ